MRKVENSANIAISNIESAMLEPQDESSASNEVKSEADSSLACDNETVIEAATDRESEKAVEHEKVVVEEQQAVEATSEPNEKSKSEPVESTQDEKCPAELKTNHTTESNHTNSVGAPTKERPKKKKSKRLSQIGKKCVLMYISPSCLFEFNLLIATNTPLIHSLLFV